MSGKRYKLSDGRTVSVPEDKATAAEKLWASKGLTYEPAPSTTPSEMDPPQYDYESRQPEQKPKSERVWIPNGPEVGAVETAARDFGQGTSFGMGTRLAAAGDAFGNWLRGKMGGTEWGTGFPAEKAGRDTNARLKGYDDYLADQIARREAGRRQHPVTAATANMAGSMVSGLAVPPVRAAQGAGLLARGAAGAANVGIDTALAAGTAAAESAPGQEAEAARGAVAPAAAMSTLFRAPGAAVAGVRAGRDALTNALPPDTAQAARVLTDLSPEGAQARAEARAGQRDLDPQVRRITELGSGIEQARDEATNWARTGGTKDQAFREAMRGELAGADVRVPGPARLPSEASGRSGVMDGGVDLPPYLANEGATVRPGRRGVAPQPSRPEFLFDDPGAEHMTRTPASPPPAGIRPGTSVMNAGAFLEGQTRQLDELLGNADDLGPASRQAARNLQKLAQSSQDKITDAIARSGDEGAEALADAHHALDLYKQRLGQMSSNLKGGADNRLTQQQLRRMYEETRQHLEDASVWGKHASGKQKRVNKAWTDDITQRDRYESTLLTSDSAKRGADPFEDLLEADPRKVHGILSNAGRASNDVSERSMREGLGTTRKLVDALVTEYNAPPGLREKAAALGQQVDSLLSEFDTVNRNMTRAREARDVAASSGTVGKAVNAVGAVEEAVRNSPAASAVARGAGKVYGVGKKLAEPARKAAAMQAGNASADRTAAASSDDATSDPKYGAVLARKDPQERAFAVAVLNSQDPAFRARERERALKRQQKEGAAP